MEKRRKNKIVHLSAIHSITFESATNVSPTGKQLLFIAKKKIVLLTISLFMSNWEKNPIPSKPSTFIQKGKDCWATQSNLWASQLFASQDFLFLKCLFTKSLQITKWPVLYEEGPTWVSRNFFHTKASAAMPSKEQGSKNWMFISKFAAWFFMASILAALKRSWSSNNWILMAEWSTSLLKI